MDANLKILVVDDDECIRRLMQLLLENYFEYVHVACDGGAAYGALTASGDFDLLITDLKMPIMDGIELAKKVRANSTLRHLPIIMVSGETGPLPALAREAGVDAFLPKPYIPNMLMLEIERLTACRV